MLMTIELYHKVEFVILHEFSTFYLLLINNAYICTGIME